MSSILTGRGSKRGRGLDWKSRKHILMGAAQGLHFIHNFPSRPPLVHANIKPSNIFIDEHGSGCISEWGLMVFASNTCRASPLHSSTVFSSKMEYATTSAWHGYRAPELLTGKEKATQESDVYSFGMVLLELVTDKEMDDEASEGETMRMAKIGVMCTKECPHERPKMNQVASMIGELL